MAPLWDMDDYDEMLRHPLAFAPEDVGMIRVYWNAVVAGTPNTDAQPKP